jgi:hypothetical protein
MARLTGRVIFVHTLNFGFVAVFAVARLLSPSRSLPCERHPSEKGRAKTALTSRLGFVVHPAPVIMLSTSAASSDLAACYGLHANAYVTKPRDFDEFEATVARIGEFWGGVAARPRVAAHLS